MKIKDRILNLLYPPKCMFCHRLLDDNEQEEGKLLCCECKGSIKILSPNESRQSFPNIKECISSFYYEGYIKDALHRYKFKGRQFYSKYLAEYMSAAFELWGIEIDLISWAPLSRKRLHKRGYDQAELLAEELSRREGIEKARLLRKTKNVKPQSITGAYDQRRENISGAYEAFDENKIKNRKILLIDDIVTTGSTLSECAGILMAAGAAQVYALTAARHRD